MVLAHLVSQLAVMNDRGEEPAPAVRVEWSEDLRTCTARSLGEHGPVAVSFASATPIGDAVTRWRMERAALQALDAVLGA